MLELNVFGAAYRRGRARVTGHTGFSGSWSSPWLQALRAEVTGLALDTSSEPSHWGLMKLCVERYRIDVRGEAEVRRFCAAPRPGAVLRLVACRFDSCVAEEAASDLGWAAA